MLVFKARALLRRWEVLELIPLDGPGRVVDGRACLEDDRVGEGKLVHFSVSLGQSWYITSIHGGTIQRDGASPWEYYGVGLHTL